MTPKFTFLAQTTLQTSRSICSPNYQTVHLAVSYIPQTYPSSYINLLCFMLMVSQWTICPSQKWYHQVPTSLQSHCATYSSLIMPYCSVPPWPHNITAWVKAIAVESEMDSNLNNNNLLVMQQITQTPLSHSFL